MAITAAALADLLAPHRAAPRWWLALSGGADSVALLHLLTELRRQLPGPWPALTALHVHHGLHPAADSWSDHCRELCTLLHVELVEERAVVSTTGAGLEAAARTARYAAFERHLGAGELLLTAHHRDDQAETLLLRLLRGTGIAGAGAMPESRPLGRGLLLRPLLGFSRAELLAYVREQRLIWVNDPSNENAAYDRNFLRLEIVPRLSERWPAAVAQLTRFAAHAREADELLQQLAAQDLEVARVADQRRALSITALRALGPARCRLLLRFWLQQMRYPLPNETQLAQVLAMFDAAPDSEPCVRWPGVEIHRYRDGLHAFAPLPDPQPGAEAPFLPPGPQPLTGAGLLQARAAAGHGLRADRHYRLRVRAGGERCRPLGRHHSQSLKKLLQEAGLPPWWRARLPLLWCDDELAAVADLWICEGYAAAANEPGWQLEWLRPGSESLARRCSRVEGEGGFC